LAKAVELQSNPTQVLNYLSGQNIEHSAYIRDHEKGSSITAIVRDHSKWNIVKVNCGIVFNFDNNDRLTSYEVREHFTGP